MRAAVVERAELVCETAGAVRDDAAVGLIPIRVNMVDQRVDTFEFDAAPEEVAIKPPEPVAPVEVATADEPDLFEASRIGNLLSLDAKPEKPEETKSKSSKEKSRGESGPEPTEATVRQAISVEDATDTID